MAGYVSDHHQVYSADAPQTQYWLTGPKQGPRVRAHPYLTIHLLTYPTSNPYPRPLHPRHCPEGRRTCPRPRGYRILYSTVIEHTPPLGLTVCSDLYSRGCSDAPDVTHDVTLHTTQLALLMQHIRWDDVHLVGLSMVCI